MVGLMQSWRFLLAVDELKGRKSISAYPVSISCANQENIYITMICTAFFAGGHLVPRADAQFWCAKTLHRTMVERWVVDRGCDPFESAGGTKVARISTLLDSETLPFRPSASDRSPPC